MAGTFMISIVGSTPRFSSSTVHLGWVLACVFAWLECMTASQARGLYVYDPKALNNIIVKEQHIYEEPRWFLS